MSNIAGTGHIVLLANGDWRTFFPAPRMRVGIDIIC